MYSHCIFCHRALGSNQVLEEQPVGRRIAFDPGHGRLWVICPRCAKWNLSPLEARWEAVEACERAFRGTRVRVSTANIAMAKLAEGLELVRIGAPEGPELAVWRYAKRMVQRRNRALLLGALGLSAFPAVLGFSWALGLPPVPAAVTLVRERIRKRRERQVLVRIPSPSREELVLRRGQTTNFVWVPGSGGEPWRMDVSAWDLNAFTRIRDESARQEYLANLPEIRLTGHEALQIASVALAEINRSTGSARQVEEAVRLIDRGGDPFSPAERWRPVRERDPISLFVKWRQRRNGVDPYEDQSTVLLAQLPAEVRLAMEIAANEEAERRALTGELHLLEAAWREAEEIAQIADSL